MKNIDSVHRTLHIKAFCIPFPFLGIAGFMLDGVTGLFLAAVLCLLISALTFFISGSLGGLPVVFTAGVNRFGAYKNDTLLI